MRSGEHEYIWKTKEADCYFDRNIDSINEIDMSLDMPLTLLELYSISPRRVLEIGCANGFRLATIHGEYPGVYTYGVDLSAKAIHDGKVGYPEVNFLQCPASDIALNELFDVAIMNFVLHWVDRSKLLRAVSEADRLLGRGGYLIIGDFFPDVQSTVPYKHHDKLFTYKQNYASIFLASGLYTEVAFLSGADAKDNFIPDTPPNERAGWWLLRKKD